MVVYAINGDDVLYSNMDGGGTPLNAGDTWTVTVGSITADISVKAGNVTCAINNDGVFYINAGVEALFNSGGAGKVTMANGSRMIGLGTSGSHCKLGGDAGQGCNEFTTNDGAIVHLEYTEVQYFVNANGWTMTNPWMFFKNCTFRELSTRIIRMYYGYLEMDNCDCDGNAGFYIIHTLYSGQIVLKDNAFKTLAGGSCWLYTKRQSNVTLIGNNTVNKAGGGAVPCDETNDITAAEAHCVYAYYDKLVLSEGNSLATCDVTLNHLSQNADGEIIISDAGTYVDFNFLPFLSFDQGDGSGDVDLYLLREVMTTEDNVVSISDSGEAEAGDNQKFTIGLSKDGYLPNTATAWADGGTASITLSAAAPRTQTNAFPSDQTNDLSKFTTGDTVYLGTSAAGGIEADAAVTNVNVQVEIYNMSDVKQGADLLNTTATLVANVEKTFYAINSNALLSRAGLAVGDYYFKITASGGTPSVGTLVSKCYFTVDALVLPQVQINDFPSDGTDDKGGFLPGDTVYVGTSSAGGVTSTVNVVNATVQVEIYNVADAKQGADLLNTTATLVATVEKTFYDMNSNVLLSNGELAAGEYYIKTTISGGTPTISSETSKTYFNVNPSQTITNQTHDVSSPYSVEIGTEITVTCDYTGDDDVWVEMNDIYFKLTNTANSCSGTITTTTVRSGGPFTITIHGPSAVSKDCSNDVTITAQSEQTSPFVAIETITEANFVLSGWDTPTVNDKWWKVGEKLVPQIFFDTRHDHYMEWNEITLPRNATSGVRLHSIFIVVAASTRAERWSMETEIRRIFSDPALCQEPYYDIDYIYIHDGGYSCWESEKDKKSGCATYFSRFEIVVRYADGATNVD